MPYKFQLNFTRKFTKGNLEGIQLEDRIRFVTRQDCFNWVEVINNKHSKGKLDYFVQSYAVRKIK